MNTIWNRNIDKKLIVKKYLLCCLKRKSSWEYCRKWIKTIEKEYRKDMENSRNSDWRKERKKVLCRMNIWKGKYKMCIIDFHSHILPGIDDGARNLNSSMSMLEQVREQKVDYMVATPHFYASQDRIETFLQRRRDAWDAFSLAIHEPVTIKAYHFWF